MIQTLRRKFIRTAMIAVTVLLVLLLGAINLVNLWQSRQQNERLLTFLSWEEGAAHQPRGLLPPLNADDRGRPGFSRFFMTPRERSSGSTPARPPQSPRSRPGPMPTGARAGTRERWIASASAALPPPTAGERDRLLYEVQHAK